MARPRPNGTSSTSGETDEQDESTSEPASVEENTSSSSDAPARGGNTGNPTSGSNFTEDPNNDVATDNGSGSDGGSSSDDDDGLDYTDRAPSEDEMTTGPNPTDNGDDDTTVGSGGGGGGGGGGDSNRGTSDVRSGDLSDDQPGGQESVMVDASTEGEARAQATQATGLRASQLDITETNDGGYRVSYPDAQTRAAQQLNEKFSGVAVTADDVQESEDGQFTLTESAEQTVLEQQAADELGVSRADVEIEDGQVVGQTEYGTREIFRQSGAREQVADRLGVDESDISLAGEDGGVEFESAEAREAALREQYGENAEIERVGDGAFRVTTTTEQAQQGDALAPKGGGGGSQTVVVPFGEEGQQTVENLEDVVDAQQAALDQRQQAREDIATGRLGDTQDIRSESAPQEVRKQLAEQYSEQTGADLGEEDVRPVATQSDGETVYEAELTASGREKLEEQLETSSFTAKVPEGVPLIGGASTTIKGQTREVTVSSSGNVESDERFGDIDWSMGLGGEGDEVEQAAEAFGERVVDLNQNFADEIFSDGGVGSESLGEEVADFAGYPAVGDAYEENLEKFGRGVATAPGMLASELATKPLEAAEFGVESVTNPGETGRKIPGAVTGSAAQLGTIAADNPARFTGSLVGSLGGSRSLFQATQGTRVGTATRVALQPGEEAAKALAGRGLISESTATKVPGVRTDQFGSNVKTQTTELAGRVREGAAERVPDTSLEDVVNRAQLGYQRVRYPRPSRRDMPEIDLSQTDDVDAVFMQDFRGDTTTEADADNTMADTDGDSDADASGEGVGSSGGFDGPTVEVDAGNGQVTLMRTQMESESQSENIGATETQTDGPTEIPVEVTGQTEFGVGLEPVALNDQQTDSFAASVTERASESAVETEFGGESITEAAFESQLAGETAIETALETGVETGIETELGIESGVGTETSVESAVETETELESEQEPGLESPLETEPGTEPPRETNFPDEENAMGADNQDRAGMPLFTEDTVDSGIADVDELARRDQEIDDGLEDLGI